MYDHEPLLNRGEGHNLVIELQGADGASRCRMGSRPDAYGEWDGVEADSGSAYMPPGYHLGEGVWAPGFGVTAIGYR